eukprot:13970413-Alexandrium_andersonii.AAC.1
MLLRGSSARCRGGLQRPRACKRTWQACFARGGERMLGTTWPSVLLHAFDICLNRACPVLRQASEYPADLRTDGAKNACLITRRPGYD